MSFSESHDPLAYFISIRCYGTWLHGDRRGSVDRVHNVYGTHFLPADERREYEEFCLLKVPPVELDAPRRSAVNAAIREVCNHRNWLLHALNVRTNHAHSVVTAGRDPEFVMNSFKSYATRKMKERGVWALEHRAWSRHGSTRWLWTERSVERACDYVINEQGDELPNFDEWDEEV